MPRAQAQQQLGFDEKVVEISELEEALEERLRHKVVLDATRKAYDEAHELASAEIAKLELPEDTAVRCGRFRITRSAVSARTVSFDTKATSRVRITLLDADGGDDDLDEVPAYDSGKVVELGNAARDARTTTDQPPVIHP
jgi:hypothetical protein